MGTERAPLTTTLITLTLAAGLGFGCAAPPKLRVDASVLERITIENKLLLFDAENELNIAIDSRDQVVDEIEQIKEIVDRARQKREVAIRDSEVFSDKGDAEKAKLAVLRAEALDARVTFLKAKLEWARQRLEKERAKLIVARSQFELAKAQLVKKNNVPGASDLELADFESQVEDYKADVNEADEDIQEAAAEMQAKEQAWTETNKSLQAASGGALGSQWLE